MRGNILVLCDGALEGQGLPACRKGPWVARVPEWDTPGITGSGLSVPTALLSGLGQAATLPASQVPHGLTGSKKNRPTFLAGCKDSVRKQTWKPFRDLKKKKMNVAVLFNAVIILNFLSRASLVVQCLRIHLGPGRSHMLRGNQACVPQLLKSACPLESVL